MNTETANAKSDEEQIRELISKWAAALEARDVDGLTASYDPNVVLFDAIPPYKTVGVESIREVWTQCLPHFPKQFTSEHRDITIHVSGDTAFAFCLHNIATDEADHPASQTWLRVTVGYRRIDCAWKVVHEHVSIPFNPLNNQVWHIKDPDTLDMPDYSQACGEGGAE